MGLLDFLLGKSEIQGERRLKCLAYLEEELKASKIHQEERELYKGAILESDSRTDTAEEFRKEIKPATKRLVESVRKIIKIRSDILPVPEVALSTFTSWSEVYNSYLEWALEIEKGTIKDRDNNKENQLQQIYNAKLHVAMITHERFVEKLKLTREESRALFKKVEGVSVTDYLDSLQKGTNI